MSNIMLKCRTAFISTLPNAFLINSWKLAWCKIQPKIICPANSFTQCINLYPVKQNNTTYNIHEFTVINFVIIIISIGGQTFISCRNLLKFLNKNITLPQKQLWQKSQHNKRLVFPATRLNKKQNIID